MSQGRDAARWQHVRLQLMHRWPALIRALPERTEIVRQGGAIGLSDGAVILRADWLDETERSLLARAVLHLAAHAALGHRPWRQHASMADKTLDHAAHQFLIRLGIDPEAAAWCEDHHGAWPGVPVRAPGESWVTWGAPSSSVQSGQVSLSLGQVPENGLPADSRQIEPISVPEIDERASDTRRPGAAGDLYAHRVKGHASARLPARQRGTDWRALLRLWLVQRSYQRWQFDRPARRRVDPFILPRLSGRQLRVAVALDISGSIDPQWFALFFREIEALRGLLPLQLRLLTCDNRIHLDRAMQGPAILPPFTGGGGTDFRPVFTRLAGDAGLDALIYCTDLMGEYPANTPHFPVFWLVPGVVRMASAQQPDPPFGCVLTMHEGVGA